jgi:hypothetical protein
MAQNTMPQHTQATMRTGGAPTGYSTNPPPVQSSVSQYFVANDITAQQALAAWEQRTNFSGAGAQTVMAYRPVLFAQLTVRYQDAKRRIYTTRPFAYHVPTVERSGIIHWEEFAAPYVDPRRLSGEPLTQAIYGDLPPGLTDPNRMKILQREVVDILYTTSALKVPFNSTLNVFGNPDRDFSEFRAAAQQAAREKRDAEVDTLTAKYQAMLDKLDDKMRQNIRRLDSEKAELAERRREEMFTTGEAVLSLIQGRTAYTLSRMSRASLYRKQTREDIKEFEGSISDIEQEVARVQEEFQAVLRESNERWAKVATTVEEFTLTPFKKDISLDLFGIGWIPFWYGTLNGQPLMLPALTGGGA